MNLSVKCTFNRVTGNIVIEDITDYASQGIDSGYTITGFIRMLAVNTQGTTVVYDNLGGSTPDITPPSSVTNAVTIPIPIDSVTGNILPATYQLTYQVNADNGSEQDTGNLTVEYEYLIVDPLVCIQTTVNCSASTAMSKDVTDYDQQYATTVSLTRTHTLYPPPASGAAPISGNLQTMIYTPIYTTNWQAKVLTDITYLQTDNLYVVMQVSGIKDFQVVCDTNLSKVLCCLYQLDKTYTGYITRGQLGLAESFQKTTIQPTWGKLLLFLAAMSAGNETKAASAYAEMIAVSGCSEDCGCQSEVSIVQINNTGSNGSSVVYVVDSPDNSISVVQQVNGSTVTFHVQLSQALQQAIANATQTQVASNTPYISVTPSGTNPIIYTIGWTGPTIPTTEFLFLRFILSYNPAYGPGADYLILSYDVIGKNGPYIDSSGIIASIGINTPNLPTDSAIIRVQNFISVDSSSPPKYIADSNVMKWYGSTPPPSTWAKWVEAEVYHLDTASTGGDLYLRLYDPSTGNPLTLYDIYNWILSGSLIFQLSIKAQ